MSQSTAGKGPGLVMRAANRSGTLRVSVSTKGRAMLEVRGIDGPSAELGLTAEELRVLARALDRAAAALTAATYDDEATVP
jgi:hypothetical protein